MSLVGQYSPSLFQEVFAQLHEVVDGYVIEDWGALAVRAAAPPPPGRARPSDRLRFCLEGVGSVRALCWRRAEACCHKDRLCAAHGARCPPAGAARFFGLVLRAGPGLQRAPAVTRRAARPRAQSAVSAEQRALILRNWAALQRSRTGVDGAKAQMLATLSNSGTDTNLQSYNLRTIVVRPPAGARVG